MTNENSVLDWLRQVQRRIGTKRVLDTAVVATGLIAIAAYSLPGGEDWQNLALQAVLWACLSVFALEWLQAISAAPSRPAYWHSLVWIVDAIAVLPVPVALLFGAPSPLAWLLGAFWLFKLVRTSPGLARLGRVLTLEARPLGSVLVLFLTILFFGAVALHLAERHVQPQTFGSLPSALWWAVATLTTTGYGDAVPVTQLGRVVAGFVMICGVGVFGLSDRHSRDRLRRRKPTAQFRADLAARDQRAVLLDARCRERHRIVAPAAAVAGGGRHPYHPPWQSRRLHVFHYLRRGGDRGRAQAGRLGPGAFFGELALLGNGIRNATVRSTLPTTLLVLDLPDFRVFCASHPELSAAIEAEAQKRSGTRQRRAAGHGRARTRGRNMI